MINQDNAFAQLDRFKTLEIIDRNGFEKPVKAANIAIPTQWQASGGIFWNHSNPCPVEALKTDWYAYDNSNFLLQLPSAEAWQASNVPSYNPIGGSLILPIATVKQYLESFVDRYRPNARILGYGDRQDLTVDYTVAAEEFNCTAIAMGSNAHCIVQGGEILIQYENGGHAFEEIVMAVASIQTISAGDNYSSPKINSLFGNTKFCMTMRAAVGKLNLKLVETIRQSLKIASDWQTAVTQINEQKQKYNLEAVKEEGRAQQQNHIDIMNSMRQNHQASLNSMNAQVKRHQSYRAAVNYAQDLHHQSWQNKQASQERGHQQFVRSIRNTAMFFDPRRQQNVELSNTHNTAWQLNDLNNTKHMTDDPSFNPYRDFGVDGYKLHRQEQ